MAVNYQKELGGQNNGIKRRDEHRVTENVTLLSVIETNVDTRDFF